MKALSRLLLSAVTAGGAVAALSTQAYATLQFSGGSSATEQFFTCVDNDPVCDTNPATGVITFPEINFDGLTAVDVTVTATADSLSFTVGSLTNDTGAALSANFAVSDTDFSGDTNRLKTSFTTTWTNAAGSSIGVAWFEDPANAQGANMPTDAPGSKFDSASTDVVTGNQSESHSNTVALAVSPSFSLTMKGSMDLANGGTVSASDSVTAAIPEASTWTMLIAGFAGLGIAGYRVSRKRTALAV
jgi:hypothetical protein